VIEVNLLTDIDALPVIKYGRIVVVARTRSMRKVDPTLTVRSSDLITTVVLAGITTDEVKRLVEIVAVCVLALVLTNVTVGYTL
jgi:hypothetical protein